MQIKKYYIVAVFIGSIFGAGTMQTQAAIPVIDSQNIAQQLKTYTETAKVVSQTAQQIAMQAKELAGYPTQILNAYTNGINNSINTVNHALSNATIAFATTATEEQITQYWNNRFPKLNTEDGWLISEQNHQAIKTNMREQQSEDNRKTLDAYKTLMSELDKSQQMLNDLLDANKNIQGNKQGQQLANQIAGVQSNIKKIELAMAALDNKRKLENDQAKIIEKQNEQILADQRSESEHRTISAMDTTSTTKAVDDPFTRYGATSINW